MGNQPAYINIQVRNRFSVGHLLKIAAPVVAATVYGLFKNSTALVENQRPHVSLTPYVAGGVALSGISFALTSRRSRAYVKLTYRNVIGTISRVDGQWIDVGKSTSISINSLSNGWVDIDVSAGNKQGLKIQQINIQTESARTVASDLGKGPKTNGDGDFGIEGGSGTASDPYLLSSVSVYPDNGDGLTGYGGGFYYASGGSVDGYTFPPGYYQDQSVLTPLYEPVLTGV